MLRSKNATKAKRLVWRMSPTNPAGEFVVASESRAKASNPVEIHERTVRESSMELSDGADVFETEMSTLPGELIDVFLKARG